VFLRTQKHDLKVTVGSSLTCSLGQKSRVVIAKSDSTGGLRFAKSGADIALLYAAS